MESINMLNSKMQHKIQQKCNIASLLRVFFFNSEFLLFDLLTGSVVVTPRVLTAERGTCRSRRDEDCLLTSGYQNRGYFWDVMQKS